MASKNVIVSGDKQLDAAMAQFEVKIQKQGIRKVTRLSAKHVLSSALSYVPVATGALAASLVVKARKRSRTSMGHSVLAIKPTATWKGERVNPWYGHFSEFGTVERRQKSGKSVGAVPKWPWMRMALYGSEAAVRRIMINGLRNWIRTYKPKVPKVKAA